MGQKWRQIFMIVLAMCQSFLVWSDCFESCQVNYEYCLNNAGTEEQCAWAFDNCKQTCPHDGSTEMVLDKSHQDNQS
jgi:hypothetical protein